MEQERVNKLLLYLGWLITAVVIFIISLLVVPIDNRNNYFIYKIIWTEILNLIFWSSVIIYIQRVSKEKETSDPMGGVVPAIPIITSIYVFISIVLMVIDSYIRCKNFTDRTHLLLQIILFVLMFLLIIFLIISQAFANSHHKLNTKKIKSPKELYNILDAKESLLENRQFYELKNDLKRLKEIIYYSIHDSDSLIEFIDYQELVYGIDNICYSLNNINDKNSSELKSLQEEVKKLIVRAEYVSKRQIRR